MFEYNHLLQALKTHSAKVAAPGEEFALASGGKSRFFFDVKKTALHGEYQVSLATLLYDELAQGTFGAVEAVAGVALGGCHLASIVGLYARMAGKALLHVIYVRKEAKDHGTKNLVEHPIMLPDQRVVLLEDVVTTGGSSVAAIRNLTEVGYKVTGAVAVIDRRPREKREKTLGGVPFRAIYTLEDFQQ